MADIKGSSLATGLQAYWDMEEASSTRYDLVGSANLTANGTGGIGTATGKIGNCADLNDGDGDYFNTADSAAVSIVNGWSTSMWFYIDSTRVGGAGEYYSLIGKRSGENGINSFIQNDAGTWYLYVGSGSGAFSGAKVNTALSTNTWYHVVTYYNGSSTKCYLNGSSTTINIPTITDSGTDLQIGAGSSYPTFPGRIEEVGIWNNELDQTEVNSLYNSGNGLPYYDPTDIKNDATLSTSLVSYWKLDETSGTRNDSHSTNHLSAGTAPSYATGILGNGADFESGSNEYIATSGDVDALDITGNFSISFWMKSESLASTLTYSPAIVSKGTGTTGYALAWDWTSNVLTFVKNDTSGYAGTTVLSNATWYHCIVTFNGTNIIWYINGKNDTAGVAYTAHTGNATAFTVGRSTFYATRDYDGIVDELAIYSKALTVAEVRALYGYGTPPVYEATSGGTVNSNFFAFF